MKNKKKTRENIRINLSPTKKKVFGGVLISLPFLFFFLLEIGLHVFNYGGNLDLFIQGPEGYGNFLQCNPDIALRYFYSGSLIPNPPQHLFLKQKPSNGYRVFVLGESSVVGFPYEINASFPNILERALSKAFPEKRIEIISVAMSAINSYTLLDQINEVLQQSPDALLIYTGHNEYYGALGVGSVQSLGNMRWLIRTYLKLQSMKTFLLLRDCIGWIKVQVGKMLHGADKSTITTTLMESIVAEQTIPYGSPLYEAGKKQFEENMDIILQKASKHGVPVLLSELVSNLNGQEPFISVEDKEGQSAKSFFNLARMAEEQGEYEKARQLYIKAKDFDALRFRAPEDFNVIVKRLAQKYSLPVVPMISYFEKESPDSIMGSTLFLEHLHPNRYGYYLMAKAFYETMEVNHLISTHWPPSCIEEEQNQGFTELDSVYAAINIQHLKSGWPFQPKTLPNLFIQNYHPSTLVEEIAFHSATTHEYSLEQGHLDLGDYYTQHGQFDQAFLEYNAALVALPHEPMIYLKIANVLYAKKEYDKSFQLMQKSSQYKETPDVNKWLGAMAIMSQKYKEAIPYLKKADVLDPQVIYYLSRAFYLDNQWDKGEEYYLLLKQHAPQSTYFMDVTRLRSTLRKNHK